jgi:hypothetical protein
MTVALERAGALLCASLLATSLVACASTVSTAGFHGEQQEVAQAISNLHADATAGDQQKICTKDLARAAVARLNAARGGCKQAIKNQLAEVDNYDLSVRSVQVTVEGARRGASARVKTVYDGKARLATLSLLKEGGSWKISGVG